MSIAHSAVLVPIRVTVFYLICIVLLGILVSPYNHLLFGGSSVASSPFVISINQAGIKGLPDFLNAVIVVSVSAIAAEGFYVASRILQTMAQQGLILRKMAKVDSKGRPVYSLLVTALLSVLFTYINLSAGGTTVFNWLGMKMSLGLLLLLSVH